LSGPAECGGQLLIAAPAGGDRVQGRWASAHLSEISIERMNMLIVDQWGYSRIFAIWQAIRFFYP